MLVVMAAVLRPTLVVTTTLSMAMLEVLPGLLVVVPVAIPLGKQHHPDFYPTSCSALHGRCSHAADGSLRMGLGYLTSGGFALVLRSCEGKFLWGRLL